MEKHPQLSIVYKLFTAETQPFRKVLQTMVIATQFPKPESSPHFSTNIQEWQHEIPDEDDRAQIELWARHVSKGKMTEEEFGERVKELDSKNL
jgi:hypothetical protein